MTSLQVEYFLCLCELRSITAAAEHCHVTQPVISRQIRALEGELNLTLFYRTHKGMELTESGKVIYAFLSSAATRFQSVKLEARCVADSDRQVLRVGILEYNVIQPMRELFRRVGRDYGVELRLDRRRTPIGANEVLSGEVDVAMTFDDVLSQVSDLAYRPLFPNYDCIFAAPDLETAVPGVLTLEDCAGRNLYLSRSNTKVATPQSHPALRLMNLPQLADTNFVFLRNSGTVMEQVRAGEGVGCINSSGLMNVHQHYLVRPLERSSDMVVAWRRRDDRAAVRALVDGLMSIDWGAYQSYIHP